MQEHRRRSKQKRTTLMDHYCGRFGQLVDRKRAEVALVVAKDNAERAATEAQAASRSKSEFLTNMSHEIRTPMNGVLGMTDLLSRTELTNRQRKFVITAHQSAETLLNIINDVLDFSRIEAGKLELDLADFDLHDTVANVIDLLAESAQNKGLEIACLVSRKVPRWVRGDPTRLRQIVFNLVGNGIKFTDHGEVVLRLDADYESEEVIVLSFDVSDTGIGIAPESTERILRPFEQADGTITRRFGGTGLGLAIAQQLIELMNGEFSIESTLGEGSVFRFTVKLTPSTAGHNQELNLPASLAGAKVLIVDDNATNREVLHYYLSGLDVVLEAVSDGKQALQRLRAAAEVGQPFDIALLDMLMPEMSGVDTAKAIKADSTLNLTRLVVLTSMGQNNDLEHAKDLQYLAYLTKPIRQSELLNQLAISMSAEPGRAVLEPQQPMANQAAPAKDESTLDIRVLVAEDNPVNQEVMLSFLNAIGCRADIVATGVEALRAVERADYDIILMDCQMPDMDGLEATRILRSKEESARQERRLPIIAVTANALEGERDRCAAAGMDDYMSKPFKEAELRAKLRRWLTLETSGMNSEDAAVDPESDSGENKLMGPEIDGATLDQEILESIRSLQRAGSENVLDKIIKVYLESSPKLLQALHDAISKKSDIDDIRIAAHNFKSSSANLGATGIATRCEQLERMARDNQISESDEILQEIESLYPLVCRELIAECQVAPV